MITDNSRNLRRSVRFSQNYLRDANLVRRLVLQAGIKESDIVYEIGPGRGIITAELAQICRVIAIEVDRANASLLSRRFAGCSGVDIVVGDALAFSFPEEPYKVFANIPFNLTAEIIRKLFYGGASPESAHLIVQQGAAEKYAGARQETQASLLLKPWYDSSIIHYFRSEDFIPSPSVGVALVSFQQRSHALVDEDAAELYRQFVAYGFGRQRANLGKSFKTVFSHLQWKYLAIDLRFDVHAQPRDLSYVQWLGVFSFFLSQVRSGMRGVPEQMLTMKNVGLEPANIPERRPGSHNPYWKHRKAKLSF